MTCSRRPYIMLALGGTLLGVSLSLAPAHASKQRSAAAARLPQVALTDTSTPIAAFTATPTPASSASPTATRTALGGTPPPLGPAVSVRQQDRSIITTLTLHAGFYCPNPDVTTLDIYGRPTSAFGGPNACVVSSTPMAASPVEMSWEWSMNGDWQQGTGNWPFMVRWHSGQLQLLENAGAEPLTRDVTIRYQGMEYREHGDA